MSWDEPPEWLRKAMRDEAERHEPDRARMVERLRTMRGRTPAPSLWRVLGATAAAAAVIFGVITFVAVGRSPDPAPPAGLPSPAVGDHTARTSPSADGTRAPHGSSASVMPEETAVPGWLASSAKIDPNSNPYWAQGNLNLTLERHVGELDVTILVVRTPGVRSTGSWTTLPREDVIMRVSSRGDRLVYRFTLRAGRAAGSGDLIFAVQYDHAKGDRDASRDTYRVRATADGQQATVRGHF